jgi:stage V sporulation protein G
MEITEVRINLNKGGKVKAFAQLVIDDCFLVGDIRVMEGKEGTVYVAMPSRRLRSGAYRDIAHPLNTETRRRLDDAILAEYRRILDERGVPAEADEGSFRTQQIANRLLSERYWTNDESEAE